MNKTIMIIVHLKLRQKQNLKKKLVCVHTSSFNYATEIDATRLHAG